MSATPVESPFEVLRTLVAYWRPILICSVASFAAAVTLAFIMTPVYRAEALLAFNEDDMSSTGLSGLASQFGDLTSLAGLDINRSGNRKEVALALLTSRGFLETFITDKNLLPTLFPGKWNAAAGTWRESRWSSPPTLADGSDYLRDHVLNVAEDRRSGLVRVTVEWRDNVVAAEWANELVSRANEVTRGWAMTDAQESQKYLRAELDRANVVELRESINRLIEAELKKEMVASVRVQYSFRFIDPAKPADTDDFVRPRRLILSLFGLFAGFLLGVGAALVMNALRRPARSDGTRSRLDR